jgi:Ca2+/Na+ antiporter
VSETLNSNTINLFGGVAVPALVISLGSVSALVAFDLAWLIGMTMIVLALLARPSGAGRTAGACVVGLYGVFLSVQIASAAW